MSQLQTWFENEPCSHPVQRLSEDDVGASVWNSPGWQSRRASHRVSLTMRNSLHRARRERQVVCEPHTCTRTDRQTKAHTRTCTHTQAHNAPFGASDARWQGLPPGAVQEARDHGIADNLCKIAALELRCAGVLRVADGPLASEGRVEGGARGCRAHLLRHGEAWRCAHTDAGAIVGAEVVQLCWC